MLFHKISDIHLCGINWENEFDNFVMQEIKLIIHVHDDPNHALMLVEIGVF